MTRVRLDIALFAVALLLACAVVFGGVLVYKEHQNRESEAVAQARYGAVLAAARDEVEAFINIDYRDAQASIDAVAEGATGEFAEQYDSSTEGVVQLLEQNQSVMDGEVLSAGVVDLDGDSATVLASTKGTVANKASGNKPVARYFRLKLDLQYVDGEWRTSNLEFVS
ncbi:nuclear transport factor 2 family protein [Nocardioides caricicola]|uniref:Nuclear transport factor 2 family protein n=1 Tax=Nocardioides caricicola TaxID=634770 RepID=A0ABW0MWV0_9ACTN